MLPQTNEENRNKEAIKKLLYSCSTLWDIPEDTNVLFGVTSTDSNYLKVFNFISTSDVTKDGRMFFIGLYKLANSSTTILWDKSWNHVIEPICGILKNRYAYLECFPHPTGHELAKIKDELNETVRVKASRKVKERSKKKSR